jgi:hypothetical protein
VTTKDSVIDKSNSETIAVSKANNGTNVITEMMGTDTDTKVIAGTTQDIRIEVIGDHGVSGITTVITTIIHTRKADTTERAEAYTLNSKLMKVALCSQ